jgi:uncharacterized membrane protein YhhN
MIVDAWQGYLFWAVACYGGLLTSLFGEYRNSTPISLAGKLSAATAYIAAALSLGAMSSSYGRLMLLGMGFCWLGDLFLVSRQSHKVFLAGLVSFLMGHVAYTVAFVERGVDAVFVVIVLALMAVFAWRTMVWLNPHTPQRMRVPVWLYVATISVMMVMAVGTHAADHNIFILTGATLFVLSDLAVARNRFVAPGFMNRAIGLPLYFTAQLLLAASMVVRAGA